MVGKNLSHEKLQQVVDKTILYYDRDGDGMINFEEFKIIVKDLDLQKKLSISTIDE